MTEKDSIPGMRVWLILSLMSDIKSLWCIKYEKIFYQDGYAILISDGFDNMYLRLVSDIEPSSVVLSQLT